jgi:DNA-binding Lrp family transcriptional regulator
MSEIKKYQMALRHLTNPRYVTRDFVVPLYTGTEPETDYETEVQPDMVVPPQDILPKNPEPTMPWAPSIPNPQDRILELAGGGSVERQGFSNGSKKEFSRTKTSKFKYPFTGKHGTIYYSEPINYAFAQSTPQVFKKYKKFKKYFDNAIEKEDYSYLNSSLRGKGKLPHHYHQELNMLKSDTPEYKIFAEKVGLDEKTLKEILEERKKFVSASKSEAFKRGKLTRINDQKIIYENLQKGPSDIKTLSKKTGLTQTETKEELRKLLQNIYAQRVQIGKGKYALEDKWSVFLPRDENKIDQLLKNFSKTDGIEKIQKDTIGDLFYKAYGKQFLPDGKTLNPTYSPSKYNAVLDKLKEYNTIRTSLKDKFGVTLELDHPLNRAALNNINATPDQLIRVNPVTKELNRGIKEKIQTRYDKVNNAIKNAKGIELEKLIFEKNGLENLTKYLELETGKISSTGKILKYGVQPFEKLDMKETIINNLKNQNLISQKIKAPEYKELANQAGVGHFKFNVPEIKEKVIQAISTIGCGQKVKAMGLGGRVKFGSGSDCYIKGIEKMKSGELTPGERIIAGDLFKEIGTDTNMIKGILSGSKSITKLAGNVAFDFIIGKTPAAVLFNFGINLPFAAYEALEGKPLRQVLGTATDVIGLGPLVGTTERDELIRTMGADAYKYFDIQNKMEQFNDNLQKIKSIDESAGSIVSPDDINFNPKDDEYKKTLVEQNNQLYNELKPFLNQKNELTFPKNLQRGPDINQRQAEIETEIRKLKTKQGSLNEAEYSVDSPQISKLQKEYQDLEKQKVLYEKEIDNTTTIEDMQNIEQGVQGAAEGGRIGLGEGGGPKMGRRGFLGLLTGAAALPEVIKGMKGERKAAQAIKAVSKIKFEKPEGMYSWFPDLVEKIKVQGKPFEETERIMEASYKHEAKGYGGLPKGVEKVTKHVDGDTTFLLREYPDGRIAVDIHSPRNQEGSSTPVTLYYRPTMELKYYYGTKVEPAEFKVLEKEPRYFANGPDDVDIEMSEMRKIPGKNTIFGDVEAAERFATGDIKNRKIIPAKQARREQMEDAPVDFIEETSHYGPVYD